jgi:hypothetical protein
VKVCGLSVPLCFASEKEDATLKGAHGYYDPDTGVIVLNKSLPAGSDATFLVHEVLHALLNTSGALRATAATLGIDIDKPAGRKQMDTWEEVFIRVITPHVLETFGPARVLP